MLFLMANTNIFLIMITTAGLYVYEGCFTDRSNRAMLLGASDQKNSNAYCASRCTNLVSIYPEVRVCKTV